VSPTWPVRPGVPAAGHVTGGGHWHPGAAEGCGKCKPAQQRGRPIRADQVKVGDVVQLDRGTHSRQCGIGAWVDRPLEVGEIAPLDEHGKLSIRPTAARRRLGWRSGWASLQPTDPVSLHRRRVR
jgi:hypothetical protein